MVNSARLENESSRIHDDTSWEPSVDAITMMIAVANKLLVQPVMDFPSDKKLSPDWHGVSTEPTPSVDIVFVGSGTSGWLAGCINAAPIVVDCWPFDRFAFRQRELAICQGSVPALQFCVRAVLGRRQTEVVQR